MDDRVIVHAVTPAHPNGKTLPASTILPIGQQPDPERTQMDDALCFIPLDRLEIDPENVRTTPPDEDADAELKANIAASGGIRQSLLVRPSPEPQKYFVTAGSRRLRLAKACVEDGSLPKTYKAPCLIRIDPSVAETIADSLAENMLRVPAHPIDQFRAFAKLEREGLSIAAIANRFGITERLVSQRLKLAQAAPELLDAYRAGDMSLDTLQAFTLATDKDRQVAVWRQLAQSFNLSAYTVRRALTETAMHSSMALARLVGMEAYEAAGGAVTRDLFSEKDEGYFENLELLRRMAQRRLEKHAADIDPDWKWVDADLEVDHQTLSQYGREHPEPVDLPSDLALDLERLRTRESELHEIDPAEWSDELGIELADLEERLEELEDKERKSVRFSEDQRKRSGCIVTVGHDGQIEVHEGLVRPEDKSTVTDGSAMEIGAGLPPEETVKDEPAYSQVLSDELAATRNQIAKAHLAADFDTAFDVTLFHLTMSVLSFSYHTPAIDLRASKTMDHPADNKFGTGSKAMERADTLRANLTLDWLSLPTQEAFATLCALPWEDKQRIFAFCVGQALHPHLPSRSRANSIGEPLDRRLNMDLRAYWTPNAETYWSRIKKATALNQAAALLGQDWADKHRSMKKKDLDQLLGDIFEGKDEALAPFDEAVRAAIDAWIPPGMTYAKAGASAEPADDETDEPVPETQVAAEAPPPEDDELPAFLAEAS